jgi:hypothetical protein
MKKTIAWRVAIVLLSVLMPSLVSAEISVTLKLDRKEATLKDSVRMVVSISAPRQSASPPILDPQESDYLGGTDKFFGSDSRPILNGLESFDIELGETSTDLGVSGSDLNPRIDYVYLIHPQKIGTFQIGPAKVAVEGKAFQSNTATLNITERPRSPDVDDETLSFMELTEGMPKPRYRSPDVDDETLLFLGAALSTDRAYMGEQVVYTLKLYRKARVSDIDLALPETEYITFKRLGNQREYESVYDGREYKVLEVRHALIPSRAGTLRILPARMTMTVYPPGEADRGTFDTPIYALTTGLDSAVQSESLELEVLPLPDEQRPSDFSGLVGNFQIDSQLEPPTIKAGESAILTVLLSGTGNLDRLPDLKLPEPEQTNVYPDQATLQLAPDDKGLAAKKTMRWALVPKKAGNFEIPPLAISFFDTETRQYRVVKTPPRTLSVLPGEKGQASRGGREGETDGGALKHVVRELGWDILPVRTSVEDSASVFRIRPGGLTSWGILLLPLCAYLGASWSLKARNKSDGAIAAMKAKRAARNLNRKCRQAGLTSNDVALAIRDYLNDRFGLSVGTLTPEEAAEILRSHGADMETTEKLRHVVRGLEDAVYTGKGNEICGMGEDIPRLVKQIEREVH